MGSVSKQLLYQAQPISWAFTFYTQLTYTYTSGGNTTNQAQSITDATSSNTGLVAGTTNYTWDGNGNMLRDTNSVNQQQNKTFTYNLLNLPQTVKVQHGMVTYTYDALGNKMRKVSVISGVTKTTDYISGIEYDGGTTDTLNFIQTEEGKAAKFGSIYDYTYYLGDNLGNTRVTFGTKTGTAVSYQTDDYYPFGMEINHTMSTPKNEYLYNKKELQEETQEYDYGARFYDALTGRWITIDPLAEKSRRWSPYNYVENDPIRLTDPDGMQCNPCDVPGDGGFVEGFKEGVTGFFTNIGHAVSNPGETISNAFSAESLKTSALDGLTGMMYSQVKDYAIAGGAAANGNLKVVGQVLGNKTAEIGTALLTDGALKGASALKGIIKDGLKVDNLGNPFKGKSLDAIRKGLDKQVEAGKLIEKHTNPVSGSKSYKNVKSGYSYNVDTGVSGKTGVKVEDPHVDVNYPNPKPKNVEPKRKFGL